MNLTTRLVVLAGLVGLMFYSASANQLWAIIADYQLDWYALGVPLAWGVILGALSNLLGFQFLKTWLEPATYIAASLITLGLTGAAAVYVAHQIGGLTLAPLMISAIGLGVYFWAYSFARFNAAAERNKDKQSK
ncbi:hypothetical protein [Pseudidiomarina taiwanensis]|uniref:Uncharacterized protein n=1 Tax=Pseudidiomarina taiwanensis TaxID=337250 RepID=A0A432ZMR7_9GAMM|nr:hypothetical protein [Pseudidiomarina taiwanensis]RUO79170.1 hypothetical protein CWI83_01260 [Pseudidiomarina taiwanensis]